MRSLVCGLCVKLSRPGETDAGRGYAIDHSTLQRWVVHYAPRIEKVFRKNKNRVGLRWRLDETCMKVKGQWKYLYRAVDKQGNTVDVLLTAKRDRKAAHRFIKRLTRAMSGFKSFRSARATLAGIELWRMLRKGRQESTLPVWQQFYVLATEG